MTGCGSEEKNEITRNKTEEKVKTNKVIETTNKVNETTNKEENKTSNVTDKAVSDIDDSKYYFFTVNGKNYYAGDKISNVQTSNLKVKKEESSDEELWAHGFSMKNISILNSKDDPIFSVLPYNKTDFDVNISEASIGGFKLNESDYKNSSDKVEIYGGITIGTSKDEVEAIFGKPTSKNEIKESTIEYKYKGNTENHSFSFTFKNGKVQSISWESFSLY